MICEPKARWRHVAVTGRRTAVNFAHQMRWLVDEAYPDAQVVRLVVDNLNTHKPGSLYEAKSVIDWRFSTQDARSKLQHIYPTKSD